MGSKMKVAFRSLLVVLLAMHLLSGCVVNPVTGENEIGWVSTEAQIDIGRKNYVPAQQMQGGQYKVDPALTEYVNGVGQRLAKQAPIDLPWEFVVLNNSVPNAWAMPGGKIAVNRGLLTELGSEAELAAVLGHEVVHAAARHGAKSMERGMLLQGALVAAAIGTRNQEYAGAVLGGAQLAAGLVTQKYGRDAERQSDFYGTRYLAEAGYDPQAAVDLQKTFVRLSEGRKSSWLEGLFASHPPSTERVRNNQALVKTLRAEGYTGGELGKQRFVAATARIREDAEAYAAYDAARKAAADKRYDAAADEVTKALRLQSAEAQFHGLRGDIRRMQGRHEDAVTNYDRAIARDDGYFAYYLGRGLARSQLGRRDAAKEDFSRSVNYLPTAVAYSELGKIAESEGNSDAAVRYYEAAASAPGAAGQQAMQGLVRLDLPRQPGKYVRAELARGARGEVLLKVTNTTPVTLTNIQVNTVLRWAVTGEQALSRRVASLSGGTSTLITLPLRNDKLVGGNAYAVAAQSR